MRIVAPFVVVLALAASAPRASAEEAPPPSPQLSRVDYRQPAAQKSVGEALGVGQRTEGIVRQLRARAQQPDGLLALIVRWVDRNLRFDEGLATRWRGVDQILQDGTQGGAADRALVIGAFARVADIPAVWVKTLPTAWLIEARQGRVPLSDAKPALFLEVHLGGRWQLLDPESGLLYQSHDPRARELPNGQYAYDKGGDPYALLLPNRADLWRAQLKAYVSSLDLGSLPWALTRDMLARWRVYVAGKGGPATYARASAKALGYNVEQTFNSDWERILPGVRGKTLIVVTYGGRPALPEAYWRAYLPPGYEDVVSGARKLEKGWMKHRLQDGTRVILVTAQEYGPVELAVSEALED
jgi:hypothetical protein